MKNYILYLFFLSVVFVQFSCSKDDDGCTDPLATNYDPSAKTDNGSCIYSTPPPTVDGQPTPQPLVIPTLFAQTIIPPIVPTNNLQTVEGIALGRKLFYDPILSGDGTQSCADCHFPENSFSDITQFSIGITGAIGDRNAMPIFNIAWNWGEKFFWDGRAITAEGQAFGPVVNPVEMNNTWSNAVASLQNASVYPPLFDAAFGTTTIDSVLVAKAIAQFERTLISATSKFDSVLLSLASLTPSESNGLDLFMTEGGDCFHCHGSPANPLWTDNDFHNNGLDATFSDNGLGDVTGNSADNGKFKTPSLRNLIFTAPYMHDGRFTTIDEVLDHYSTGVIFSATVDPLMQFAGQGGVQMTASEKADLKAFLLTLTDYSFVNNPDFQAP